VAISLSLIPLLNNRFLCIKEFLQHLVTFFIFPKPGRHSGFPEVPIGISPNLVVFWVQPQHCKKNFFSTEVMLTLFYINNTLRGTSIAPDLIRFTALCSSYDNVKGLKSDKIAVFQKNQSNTENYSMSCTMRWDYCLSTIC
jgi:hypothetical protein